jgi:hypothetical protein
VTRDADVGIDVELLRPDTAVEAIAERILGHSLHELAQEERPGAFYREWTRREARGKARGDGLAPPNGGGTRWWVSQVAVPDGYVAALAIEGGERAVRTAWWPE